MGILPVKFGICTGCPTGTTKPLYKVIKKAEGDQPNYGLCQSHYWISRTTGKEVDIELNEWYIAKISICLWVCENCGANVFTTDPVFQRSAQAHLLPKKTFKSVATHPDNHKTLGATCGCHSRYDLSWESAQKLKIWPEVEKIIIEILIPVLPADEYSKLPDFLKEKYEENRNRVIQS